MPGATFSEGHGVMPGPAFSEGHGVLPGAAFSEGHGVMPGAAFSEGHGGTCPERRRGSRAVTGRGFDGFSR